MFYKIGLKNRKNKNEFNLYNKLVSFANKIFVLLGLKIKKQWQNAETTLNYSNQFYFLGLKIKNQWQNAKTTLNTSARRKLRNLSTRTEFRRQIQVTIFSILKR